MNILIAEDNEVSQKILVLNLQKLGYEVIPAWNGKEALACLESNPAIQLVITDIMMPEMDGLTLLKTVKTDSRWKNIPVILCTVLQDLDVVKSAIALGCDSYITKPIQAASLSIKIKEVLEGKKAESGKLCGDSLTLHLDERYEQAAAEFSGQVRRKIRLLEDQTIGQSAGELLDSMLELRDGATLLRAQRLSIILNRMAEMKSWGEIEAIGNEYLLLLDELRKLESVLPPPAAPQDTMNVIRTIETQNPQYHEAFDTYQQNQSVEGVKAIRLKDLQTGMVVYEDIWATNGRLLVARGQHITISLIQRLQLFSDRIGVVEPFHVVLGDLSKRKDAPRAPIHVETIDESVGTQGFDLFTALKAVGCDKASFLELAANFVRTIPEDLRSLQDALAHREQGISQKKAYGIAGAFGQIGAEAAYGLAFRIEKYVKESNFDEAMHLTERLKQEAGSVCRVLAASDWQKRIMDDET